MRRFLYLSDVATLKLDVARCTDCGMCVMGCPRGVFDLNDGHAKISCQDACMERGACARNCPVEAISVDVGVGCAAAVINSFLGREGSSCCCVIEPGKKGAKPAGSRGIRNRAGCC